MVAAPFASAPPLAALARRGKPSPNDEGADAKADGGAALDGVNLLASPMYAGDVHGEIFAHIGLDPLKTGAAIEERSARTRGSSTSSADGAGGCRLDGPVRIELSPSRQSALAAADPSGDGAVGGGGVARGWDSPPRSVPTSPPTTPAEEAAVASSEARKVTPPRATRPGAPATKSPALLEAPAPAAEKGGRRADARRASTVKATLSSQGVTTLMIRNIPGSVTQKQVLEELSRGGFDGTFDFVYLPCSFDSRENKGYGFINFVSPELVGPFVGAWHNSRLFCTSERDLALNVSAATIQGLQANVKKWSSRVQRIRNPELKPHIVTAQRQAQAAAAAPPPPDAAAAAAAAGRLHLEADAVVAAAAAAAAGTPDLFEHVGMMLAAANLSAGSFADLACADLSCADLAGADLTGADLTGADLTGADLNCDFGVCAGLPMNGMCQAQLPDFQACSDFAYNVPPGLPLPPGMYDAAC